MKPILHLICLAVIILLFAQFEYKTNDKTIVIKGTITSSFHLASTNRIEKHKQKEFLQGVEDIFDKMEILDKYYSYINLGKEIEANEIIESDSILSKMTQFAIDYSYMIIKMKENNILFKPLIQCTPNIPNHASYIISITEKDLAVLDHYLKEEDIEVELAIEEIFYIEMYGTIYYKLKKINPSLDKG